MYSISSRNSEAKASETGLDLNVVIIKTFKTKSFNYDIGSQENTKRLKQNNALNIGHRKKNILFEVIISITISILYYTYLLVLDLSRTFYGGHQCY